VIAGAKRLRVRRPVQPGEPVGATHRTELPQSRKIRGSQIVLIAASPSSRYLLKLALTDSAPFTVMMQMGAMLVQAPVYPAKLLPAGGVAVSVTMLPEATVAVHAEPQLMPPTLLVTTPGLLVLTLSCALSVAAPPPPPPPVPRIAVNVAPTSTSPPTITVHVGALPEHAPVQSVKVLPLPAEAVSTSCQPFNTPPGGTMLHTTLQLSVLLALITLPLPFKVTVSVGTGPAPTASPINTHLNALEVTPL